LALLLAAGTSAAAQDRGAALFEPCRACHALDPAAPAMAGPNLAGLIGRRLGGDAAFDYSPVLRAAFARAAFASGEIWSRPRLDAFLADPEAMFPGMWMSARGIDDPAARAALAGFLADPKSR
jgi:cytochrome c